MCVCVCVCVCVLFVGILYAKSISIIGRVLSEKVTVNQLVIFVSSLGCFLRIKCTDKVF